MPDSPTVAYELPKVGVPRQRVPPDCRFRYEFFQLHDRLHIEPKRPLHPQPSGASRIPRSARHWKARNPLGPRSQSWLLFYEANPRLAGCEYRFRKRKIENSYLPPLPLSPRLGSVLVGFFSTQSDFLGSVTTHGRAFSPTNLWRGGCRRFRTQPCYRTTTLGDYDFLTCTNPGKKLRVVVSKIADGGCFHCATNMEHILACQTMLRILWQKLPLIPVLARPLIGGLIRDQ